MFRSIARWFVGLSATALMVGTAMAVTSSVPYKEQSAGTVSTFDGSHVTFAGQGNATHIGKYSVTGGNDVDLLGNVSNGQVTITSVGGATLTGIYSGTYAPLPTGQFLFDVQVQWQSGTGHLTGTTGYVHVVAVLNGVAPGSAFALEGIGELLFP